MALEKTDPNCPQTCITATWVDRNAGQAHFWINVIDSYTGKDLILALMHYVKSFESLVISLFVFLINLPTVALLFKYLQPNRINLCTAVVDRNNGNFKTEYGS